MVVADAEATEVAAAAADVKFFPQPCASILAGTGLFLLLLELEAKS